MEDEQEVIEVKTARDERLLGPSTQQLHFPNVYILDGVSRARRMADLGQRGGVGGGGLSFLRRLVPLWLRTPGDGAVADTTVGSWGIHGDGRRLGAPWDPWSVLIITIITGFSFRGR